MGLVELFQEDLRLNFGDLVLFTDKYAEPALRIGLYLYKTNYFGNELHLIFFDGVNHPRLDDEIFFVQKFTLT